MNFSTKGAYDIERQQIEEKRNEMLMEE